jgi:hypothetical protein
MVGVGYEVCAPNPYFPEGETGLAPEALGARFVGAEGSYVDPFGVNISERSSVNSHFFMFNQKYLHCKANLN